MTLFNPKVSRRDRDEDGFPPEPFLSAREAERAVTELSEALQLAEVPMSAVLAYTIDDWNDWCERAHREEWRELIDDAIASRICCRLLQTQIAEVAARMAQPARKQPAKATAAKPAFTRVELVVCCPECLSTEIICESWESGPEAGTGYSDRAERFRCLACDATGEATEVAYTQEVPARREVARARQASANVARVGRAVRVELSRLTKEVA